MTWWKKAFLLSVAWVVLIFAICFVFANFMQDEAVSTICGMLCGSMLVVVWIRAFLLRAVTPIETSNRETIREEVILSARTCNYLKHAFCLVNGMASITDKRFIWDPTKGLVSRVSTTLYGVKSISISLPEVRETTRTTHGLSKNLLCIQINSDQQYRFLVDDVDTWIEVLTKH